MTLPSYKEQHKRNTRDKHIDHRTSLASLIMDNVHVLTLQKYFLSGIVDQIKSREGNLPAVHVKFSVAKVAVS